MVTENSMFYVEERVEYHVYTRSMTDNFLNDPTYYDEKFWDFAWVSPTYERALKDIEYYKSAVQTIPYSFFVYKRQLVFFPEPVIHSEVLP